MKYENGIETKNLILQKSKELFFKKGFKDTTIRQIAEKTHLSSGALYKHFPNKEAILDEIVKPVVDEWWELCESQRQIWENKQTAVKNTEDIPKLFKKLNYNVFHNFVSDHYDILKFVLFNSRDTDYETFFDDFVEWEANSTMDLLIKLNPSKKYLQIASNKELKYIIKGYLSMLVQSLNGDFSDDERDHYYELIELIYTEFWKKIFIVSF